MKKTPYLAIVAMSLMSLVACDGLKTDSAKSLAGPDSAESVAGLVTADPSVATPGDRVHAFAPCWTVFNKVEVDGGLAAWNISCNNGTDARITGWVEDTKKDGKCAIIKAFSNNGQSRVPLAQACPKGKKTHFDWMAPGANDIRAYLFTS